MRPDLAFAGIFLLTLLGLSLFGLVTLAERLKTKDKLEKIGGGAYLASLDLAEPTAAHISHYASIVKDYSLARELIGRAEKIVAQSYEPGSDIDSLLDQAEQSIFEVAEHKIKPSFHELREVVNDSFKRLEELADRKEPITGVASGFIDLDGLTAGFQDSDLVMFKWDNNPSDQKKRPPVLLQIANSMFFGAACALIWAVATDSFCDQCFGGWILVVISYIVWIVSSILWIVADAKLLSNISYI